MARAPYIESLKAIFEKKAQEEKQACTFVKASRFSGCKLGIAVIE